MIKPPVKWVTETLWLIKEKHPDLDDTAASDVLGKLWYTRFNKKQREAVALKFNGGVKNG
jgi:hypothetical protein